MGAKGYSPDLGFRAVSSDVNNIFYSNKSNNIEKVRFVEDETNPSDFQSYLNLPFLPVFKN